MEICYSMMMWGIYPSFTDVRQKWWLVPCVPRLHFLTRKKENQSRGSWHLAWTTNHRVFSQCSFIAGVRSQSDGAQHVAQWQRVRERHMLIRFTGCRGYTCHIQSTLQVFQSQCTWESHHPSTRNIQEKPGLLVQRQRPGFDRIW